MAHLNSIRDVLFAGRETVTRQEFNTAVTAMQGDAARALQAALSVSAAERNQTQSDLVAEELLRRRLHTLPDEVRAAVAPLLRRLDALRIDAPAPRAAMTQPAAKNETGNYRTLVFGICETLAEGASRRLLHAAGYECTFKSIDGIAGWYAMRRGSVVIGPRTKPQDVYTEVEERILSDVFRRFEIESAEWEELNHQQRLVLASEATDATHPCFAALSAAQKGAVRQAALHLNTVISEALAAGKKIIPQRESGALLVHLTSSFGLGLDGDIVDRDLYPKGLRPEQFNAIRFLVDDINDIAMGVQRKPAEVCDSVVLAVESFGLNGECRHLQCMSKIEPRRVARPRMP